MSFLDLYQGDQDQAARMQPNEGTRLPSGFGENLHAAWSDGQLFSQSVARSNARNAVLGDYIDEIRAKTGNDISKELDPDAGAGTIGPDMFEQANARVAKLKESYPELDLAPLSDEEIDKRALAKSQAAHRTYQNLEAGEKTAGGSVGSFLGSAGSAAADPINIIALGIAPETGGASILSAALRWGALAGVSQAAIEAASDTFKEQVQPGYMESGEPIKEIGGAFLGGAVLGGGFKALGNAWTRVKTGQWPTSVRDAGNVIESEANVADTNIFPGVEGEVAHREALVKTIDDILAGRPVDVGAQITPELTQAAVEAERAKIIPEPPSGLPPKQLEMPLEGEILPPENVLDEVRETMAGAYMDMMPGQSALDVAIDSVKDEMAAGDTHAPGGAPWKDVLSELQRRKRSGKDATINAAGDFVPLETPDEMQKTLAAPDHQDAIRADIDRERAMGDFKVPGVDENGNHTMHSVDAAIEEVDAYKKLADDIQACANPVQEAAE